MDRQMRELVFEAMDELNARERKIVRKRFGFGTKALSLQQVGEVLDLSRERVRQIEKVALAKMLERIEGTRSNGRPRRSRRDS
jgi:RNA polymerase sigma factor (sigma-70 family)